MTERTLSRGPVFRAEGVAMLLYASVPMGSIVLVIATVCCVVGAWLALRDELRRHQDHSRPWR